MIRSMPQSLSKVILHVIFSTKGREPWLDSNARLLMHAYLATICRDLSSDFVHAGGVADHVHIVTILPRTVSQAELIEQIKKASLKWIKALDARYRGFFWQRGYGAFSVSPSQLDAVLQYLETQQEHHRTRSFEDEYRDFFCTSTALILMSAMSGIEANAVFDSRFRRLFLETDFSLGRCPRLK